MENHRSFSPVNLTVEAIGDKWALLILRDVIFENKQYFKELLSSAERVASNILSKRLLKLEADGLLIKQINPANKYKTRYRLTQKSIDLLPLIVESMAWSLKYEPVDTDRYRSAVQIALNEDAREELRKQLIKDHLTS